MSASQIAVKIIHAFESCLKPTKDGKYTTYVCPGDALTIGWGTTRDDVPELKPGDVWSKEHCDSVFTTSLPKYENIVARYEKRRKAPTAQHHRDALISLVYNTGPAGLAGNVGRAFVDGRDSEIPKFLARWNKADGKILPGLVRRRKAEGQLYLGDLTGAYKTAQLIRPGTMPQSREVPKPTPAELARATPRASTATGAAVGVAPASAATADKNAPVAAGVLIVFGIAVAAVAVILLARKWSKLREDWA
jgi:lysozyme